MSLPKYLIPFRRDIIAELKYQKYDEKTKIFVIANLKGRKREEEMLIYLKSIRDLNMNSESIIYKTKEIIEQWDMFWGFIIDENCDEVYQPKLYTKYY